MNNDVIGWLVQTTAATSAALILVLLLRRPMRAAFGAGAAYALWALVPVALIAVSLPAPVRPVVAMPLAVKVGTVRAVADATQAPVLPWTLVLGIAWAVGALSLAALQLWQQRRFIHRLGPMRLHAHGLRVAATSAGLPAVTGILRPRIVLPADFLRRYDAAERALVVAHERQHIARGDLPCNALVALLRCVYWFNPLLHWAVPRYRHDQELACDARVLQRHPRARRAYAQAMLKTQLDAFALPVGCHWHTHPIKERIVMLKRPSPRRWQTGASSVLLLALFAGGGYAAWAQQPPRAGADASWGDTPESTRYEVEFGLVVDGVTHQYISRAALNEPFQVQHRDAGHQWQGEFKLVKTAGAGLALDYKIEKDSRPVGDGQRMITPPMQATVELGGPGANEVLHAKVKGYTSLRDATPAKPLDLPQDGMVFSGDVQVSSAGKGSPVTVDGANVRGPATGARAKEHPAPRYPVEAARNGITGRVVLLIDVAADGRVTGAKVAQAEPAGVFEQTSLEQVRTWTFEPATKAGEAVASRVRVPIDFDLDPPDAQADPATAGRFDQRNYGWYKTNLRDGGVRDMRCDVLVMGTHGHEQDAACGIRRPKVEEKDAVADVPEVDQLAVDTRQSVPAPPGFMADR